MPAERRGRPNIVFILIDDMGWTDLGCQGSQYYETPHIDTLADQGMRFTNAYAACTVCSPTRASIMTGKYPARLNLTDFIAGHDHPWAKFSVPDWTKYLSHDETTFASVLNDAGYNTFFTGKWHLGGPDYYPETHGFDVNIGGCHRGLPPTYFSPYGIETIEDGPKDEYLTDRLTDEAIDLIEGSADEPFLMYLAHYAVHTPLEAKGDVVEKYANKDKHGQISEVYAAMVEHTDDSIGRIMHKLEELEIADNTIFVFFSDNGGLTRATNNAPLRHGKGSAYEGGHRVPLIVRWPGSINPGSTCDTPVISTDFYPTLLEACGLPAMPEQHCDGKSLMPLLTESGQLQRQSLFWHYPHYHFSTPYAAVRKDDLKLIEYFESGRTELYDLDEDLSEQNNLAESEPEKAQ
ncbi:MAG: sulfatase, partial [Planctomycetes bacterium]|nr:sulfatase [Planctomycetota bacterium]